MKTIAHRGMILVLSLIVISGLAAWGLISPATARAIDGSNRCLILAPDGGPRIKVEINSFWGQLTGTITFLSTGQAFTVNGSGEAVTEDDKVTCNIHLSGSSSAAGSMSLLNANLTVHGTRDSASISFTDVDYHVTVNVFGSNADQDYSGSGPIVLCP